MRLLKMLRRQFLRTPFRVAAVDDQRHWRTAILHLASMRLAREIERRSRRPHVGFMLPTSGLSPLTLLAIWSLGRTAVPLNYLLKPDDLRYVMEDAELDLVVTVRAMTDLFGELPGSVQGLRLEELDFGGLPTLRRDVARDDDHLAVLLYTSGTSGRPKGVMLTAANLATNIEQSLRHVRITREDILLGVLPQFHSFGLTVLTLLPLAVGCPVVYTARFAPRRILELLQAHRPTMLVMIPSMYNALLSARGATPDHFRSLRYIVSGGEPLPEAVAQGFFEKFGVRIAEGYGLTETSPVTNLCLPEEYRARSVGRALPGVEERILDAGGAALPPGQDGEICIRGGNVMRGYYKLPEETAKVFDADGFFHTGDMGRFDEDGHLYITGRIKDMLIIGGENVFPREIEEVLDRHPTVHASAVIGVADQSRGEVPLAFVELEEGATFAEQILLDHCRQALPRYKVPAGIRLVDALPRNPTGKIMRRELRP